MMLSSRLRFALVAALLLVSAPPALNAADVLESVPTDAFGFVVIKNLGATNSKAEQLLQSLQLQFPGPLTLLNAATGVGDGLDPHGDLLLTILPGEVPTDRPQFCIWLPVSDYKQLVASLNGTPSDGITAVTIAGEDLLIAQRGKWAVIMDPDQRDRMQRVLTSAPTPPAKLTVWRNWINSNNLSAMLLPSGWHALLAWAANDRAEDIAALPAATDTTTDELFGTSTDDGVHDAGSAESGSDAGDVWSQLRMQIRAQLQNLPQLARWAAEADGVACGVRIDDHGNALAGVRVAVQHDWPMPVPRESANAPTADDTPPTLYQSGDYIMSGAAKLPGTLAVDIIGTYARLWTEELKSDIRVTMDEEAAARFQKAVEEATAVVAAASVLTRPGEKPDGTYSNAFLAVRVTDATVFADRFAEVMRLWNEMNKSDEDESRLLFEKESEMIGSHTATVYSMDMVEAFGSAAIPEVRPSMERLFGPGGKLRLMMVPVDKHVVLLAAATAEQAQPVLDELSRGKPIVWDEHTNPLLPSDADWRLMISPQGHTQWLKRQMDAMLGPVIGAPLVLQFPSSPPIGSAGGVTAHEIWADAAVPAETIRATGQYLHQR